MIDSRYSSQSAEVYHEVGDLHPYCKHPYRGMILTFTCRKLLGIQNAGLLQRSNAGIHKLQAGGELFFYILLSVCKSTKA